jgi:hypothetical protein
MPRRSFVQIDGVLYERGVDALPESADAPGGPTVLPDLPDFVSPIDGKLYAGRAGLREHCRRHDVVPNADLVGLKPLTTAQEYKPDRAAIRQEIIKTMYQKGLMR